MKKTEVNTTTTVTATAPATMPASVATVAPVTVAPATDNALELAGAPVKPAPASVKAVFTTDCFSISRAFRRHAIYCDECVHATDDVVIPARREISQLEKQAAAYNAGDAIPVIGTVGENIAAIEARIECLEDDIQRARDNAPRFTFDAVDTLFINDFSRVNPLESPGKARDLIVRYFARRGFDAEHASEGLFLVKCLLMVQTRYKGLKAVKARVTSKSAAGAVIIGRATVEALLITFATECRVVGAEKLPTYSEKLLRALGFTDEKYKAERAAYIAERRKARKRARAAK